MFTQNYGLLEGIVIIVIYLIAVTLAFKLTKRPDVTVLIVCLTFPASAYLPKLLFIAGIFFTSMIR